MSNVLKELVKDKIRETGTYRVVVIENENLKNQDSNLRKEIQELKNQNNNLRKEIQELKNQNNNVKKDFVRLTNNLMVENKSIKELFEKNIKLSSDYNKLTVIIPYRKTDDPEREENVDITLKYLSKIGVLNLIISEHSDVSSKEFLMSEYSHLFKSFKVIHVDANGELFNLAKAINRGIIESATPYIAYSDIDCITKKKNVDLAIVLLNYGFDVVHPFNRRVTDITDKEKFKMKYNFETVNSPEQNRLWADGGMVFWNKYSLISVGMKNEYFSGWGGEDNDLMIRSNLCKLKKYRIDDTLYHLYHNRPLKRTQNNIDQLEKTMQMENKEECLNEVNKWPWVIKAKNRLIRK